MEGRRGAHLNPGLGRRVRALLRAEGIPGLAARAARRLRPIHRSCYIVDWDLDIPRREPLPAPAIDVEVSQLTAPAQGDLEALAGIDAWRSPPDVLARRFGAGWECFVARHRGEIAAAIWNFTGVVRDPYLRREFELADHEVYLRAGTTAPGLRGKGILPHLIGEVAKRLALRDARKTRGYVLVDVPNPPALRLIPKLRGSRRIGRMGFVEVLGVRFHYITARDVFRAGTRRFYWERVGAGGS